MFFFIAQTCSADVKKCIEFAELSNSYNIINLTATKEQYCFKLTKSYFFFTPNNFSIDISIPKVDENGSIAYIPLDNETTKPLGFLNNNAKIPSHAAISVKSDTKIHVVPVGVSDCNTTQFFTTSKKLKREYTVADTGIKIRSFVFNYFNSEKAAYIVKNTGTVALDISKNGVVKSSIEQNGIKNFKFTGQVSIIPVFSGVESSDVELEVKTLHRPDFIPEVEMELTGDARYIPYRKTHKISDSRDAIIGSTCCIVIIVFYIGLYFFCCRNEKKDEKNADQAWVMM